MSREARGPPPVPEPLTRFAELLERGAYWESHEVLEGLWRERDSDFLQGLILWASAFVHAKRDNRHGIDAQLAKAEAKLAASPPTYLGVDVARVRTHIRRCREIVEATPRSDAEGWIGLLPPPRLELHSSLVRGDEPELR